MLENYLCIGHCCHDKVGETYILGGTTSYAAVLSKALGMQPMILTSVGEDFHFFETFKTANIPFHHKAAPQTTTFENIYADGQRTQYLLARAASLDANDVLAEWQAIPVVHFGLIADEIDASIVQAFPKSLKGATIQGLLRQWNERGLVSPKEMDWAILAHIDVVILSDEDIRGVEHFLEKIIRHCPQVVITHGAEGATVYQNGQSFFFPSFPVQEVDPTGAGDAFTTAYLVEYYKSRNIHSACIMAHCTASFVIEAEGITNLPSVAEVIKRKGDYLEMFSEFG